MLETTDNPLQNRICGMRHGAVDAPLLFANQEELRQHVESDHHEPVPREGETYQQMILRFVDEHPEAMDCKQCRDAGRVWARGERA